MRDKTYVSRFPQQSHTIFVLVVRIVLPRRQGRNHTFTLFVRFWSQAKSLFMHQRYDGFVDVVAYKKTKQKHQSQFSQESYR
jgi:hypothetical protein